LLPTVFYMTQAQVISLLKPENAFESHLVQLPELYKGLLWGEPRFGHPEGKVVYHVKEVFGNIDRLADLTMEQRANLRAIAIAHDAFKHLEEKGNPRNWYMHHGAISRRYLEAHTENTTILDIIELHDEAYYCWRGARKLVNDEIVPRYSLESLVDRVKPFLLEYMLFFRCDTMTGDKNLAPLKWFEDAVADLVNDVAV
jgi:hypothetical protein